MLAVGEEGFFFVLVAERSCLSYCRQFALSVVGLKSVVYYAQVVAKGKAQLMASDLHFALMK